MGSSWEEMHEGGLPGGGALEPGQCLGESRPKTAAESSLRGGVRVVGCAGGNSTGAPAEGTLPCPPSGHSSQCCSSPGPLQGCVPLGAERVLPKQPMGNLTQSILPEAQKELLRARRWAARVGSMAGGCCFLDHTWSRSRGDRCSGGPGALGERF